MFFVVFITIIFVTITFEEYIFKSFTSLECKYSFIKESAPLKYATIASYRSLWHSYLHEAYSKEIHPGMPPFCGFPGKFRYSYNFLPKKGFQKQQ